MRIAWTPAAADDLEHLADFLFEQNAATAIRLVRQIYSAASTLKQFPDKGRPGKKRGTRELVLPGLPWIIIYDREAALETVRIIRILHGAQRWP
jgi:toxin ParE1/3/4